MALARLAIPAMCLLGGAAAQKAGTKSQEGAPLMDLTKCTGVGTCTSTQTPIVLDGNWRWVHEADGYTNCYKGSDWDASLCPDGKTCAAQCALEGVTSDEYRSTYGISAVPGGIELKFVSKTQYGDNYGSRVYMMEAGADSESYEMFMLKNREFSMDVDVSGLPCGLNGAVYFVEMDKLGGKGGSNEAGAKYGTGYCDAQCPHDIKFIEGEANVKAWNATAVPPIGHYGACCAEMDIWEANSMATAYTPHSCAIEGVKKCEGTVCGDTEKGERYMGVCDKDGCDFNSFRMGEKNFYGAGPGFSVDTTKPFTLVTQFLTTDNTDAGDLSEIRRFYVQDGKMIQNSQATVLPPAAQTDSITDAFCKAQKAAFADPDDFQEKGGMKAMGQAIERGMVLVMSLWDDTKVNMLWLDAKYPTNQPDTKPGVMRGPCPGGTASSPAYLRSKHGDASVKFTNVKVGEIGSTADAGGRRLDAAYV